ncbi:MAG: hypothetical protein H7249_02975 [Chitinophagaceae bacterium]|nr:hypothetical protein [Oligoflexus sp.]
MEAMVRDGMRWLEGLEDGTVGTGDLYILSQKMDPVLIHLCIKFLRKKYPSIKPEAAAVMARLVDLTSNYPEIVKLMKEAESDPVSEWFSDTYSFPEFYSKPEEMLELIVDKLES